MEPVAEMQAEEEPAPVSRCAGLGEPFVLGEAGTVGEGEERDRSLPFAAEVGPGVAWERGFAVGARFERGREKIVGVVKMGADGKGAHLVELGKARGDVGPPRVSAHGDSLVAALVEPEPHGRSIRLVKIEGEQARFGATLHEKKDESLAFDLALGEKRGVVAWDEEGPAGGKILLASFDPKSASQASPPRVVSDPAQDVESPKLVATPSGFWLAYVARLRDDSPAKHDEPAAEEVGFRYLSLVRLDENGAPQGSPRAITPRDGHVVAFDMAEAPDGKLLVVWRDDDGPSGSSGGRVMRTLVHPKTIDEPTVVEAEEIGGGVPSLFGRWLSLTDATDTTRLAPLAADFSLQRPLQAEPAIGNGEILAERSNVLLVAQPRGRAIRLAAMRCGGE